MKSTLMLQSWGLFVFVARLRKKIIILRGTSAKIIAKIKVTKLKYLITTLVNKNTSVELV